MNKCRQRLYVCIPVSDSRVKSALRLLARHLPPSNKKEHHITLRFIYEMEESAICALVKSAAWICSYYQPFELTLASAGYFPGVIWQGIEMSSSLLELQTDINQLVSSLGCPPVDYDYNPHITLGRTQRKAVLADSRPITWTVDALQIRDFENNGIDVAPICVIKL